MQKAFRFFQLFNLLSLNVVFGAMICHTVFLQLAPYPMPWFRVSTFLLGIGVFIIYTIDRLLDNRKKGQISTRRHAFHRKFQSQLLLTVEIFAVVGLYLLNKTDFRVILVGFSIVALSIGYLAIVSKMSLLHFLQAYKEPITALIYATGVWATAIIQINTSLPSTQWFTGFVFLLIAFQNLLLFSLFEQNNYPKVHSLASYLGHTQAKLFTRYIFMLVFGMSLSASFLAGSFYEKSIFWVEIAMSSVLLSMSFKEKFWLKNERYRWIGDSIFFLPVVCLLLKYFL